MQVGNSFLSMAFWRKARFSGVNSFILASLSVLASASASASDSNNLETRTWSSLDNEVCPSMMAAMMAAIASIIADLWYFLFCSL